MMLGSGKKTAISTLLTKHLLPVLYFDMMDLVLCSVVEGKISRSRSEDPNKTRDYAHKVVENRHQHGRPADSFNWERSRRRLVVSAPHVLLTLKED